MLPVVEKLLVIQHRDLNIRQLEKQIAGIPLEVEDLKNRLNADQKAVADALAAVREKEIEIKNLEIDAQTRRSTVARLKVQQYQTKKNEEFRAIGQEIERYEKEVSQFEDAELEKMEELDGLKRNLAEVRDQLANSEESVKFDIAQIEQSREEWGRQREEEVKRRAEAAAKVPPDLLDTYQRIFKSKNGKAVVGLESGLCTGCHMKVIKSTVVEVKAEKAIAFCENCGRILYNWTEDGPARTSNDY